MFIAWRILMTKKRTSASSRPAKACLFAIRDRTDFCDLFTGLLKLVAARIDKEVYDWLMKYGKGSSTRINGILRTVMEGTR
jgi:uncharacterized protein (DUF4415 family)